jgi:hypothetical protein
MQGFTGAYADQMLQTQILFFKYFEHRSSERKMLALIEIRQARGAGGDCV